MLRKLAVGLVAASIFAAPVLAQTGSTGTQTPVTKPAAAAPTTPSAAQTPATKPTATAPAASSKATEATNGVKRSKKSHTDKQVGKGEMSGKVNDPKVAAEKANPSGGGAVR
jgi:hypothetical protein